MMTSEDCPKDFVDSQEGKEEMDHDEWLKEIGISPKTTKKFMRKKSLVFYKENKFLGLNRKNETIKKLNLKKRFRIRK